MWFFSINFGSLKEYGEVKFNVAIYVVKFFPDFSGLKSDVNVYPPVSKEVANLIYYILNIILFYFVRIR